MNGIKDSIVIILQIMFSKLTSPKKEQFLLIIPITRKGRLDLRGLFRICALFSEIRDGNAFRSINLRKLGKGNYSLSQRGT